MGGRQLKVVTPREAAELLRQGNVGLVPTETVVGLVAGESGLPRLAGIKGRDPGKPIALLCSSMEFAFALAARVPPAAEALASSFWPGPLTLVLDSGNGGTIGLRVPDHPVVRELLAEYGKPLHATSANFAGEPAPSALAEVDERVREQVDFAVDGESGGGEASAVVDLSGGAVRLLRATAELTEERLLAIIGQGSG